MKLSLQQPDEDDPYGDLDGDEHDESENDGDEADENDEDE